MDDDFQGGDFYGQYTLPSLGDYTAAVQADLGTLSIPIDVVPPTLESITAQAGSSSPVTADANTTMQNIYVPISSDGNAALTLSGLVSPSDDGSAADYRVTAHGSNTTITHGNLAGAAPLSLPTANGVYDYDITAGMDDGSGNFTVTRTIEIHAVGLTSFTLANGNKTLTVTPSTGPNTELDVDAGDSGNVSVALSGIALGDATAHWSIDGSTATPSTGNLSAGNATVALDGSTSNNWTFQATAWIDLHGTSNQTPDDPTLSANVTLYRPKLTLTDQTSGLVKTDDTDSLATPAGMLGVVQDSTGNATVNFSLADELSGVRLTDTYHYIIRDSTGTPVDSGTFAGTGTGTWKTTSTGQFYVDVTDPTDSNADFQRAIGFYISVLQIQWNESDAISDTAGTSYAQGTDISNHLFDQFVGQGIGLKAVLTGPAASSATYLWNLGGGTGDFVDGYDVSQDVPDGDGKVDPVASDDLSSDSIHFYGVADSPFHAFGVYAQATIDGTLVTFKTSVTFNIQKPGQSVFSSYYKAEVNQQPPSYDTGDYGFREISDSTVWSVSYPVTAPGTVKFVQLVDEEADYVVAGVTFEKRNTGGIFELDNTYEAEHLRTDVLGDTTTFYGGDEPDGLFTPNVSRWLIQFQAKTWLMWAPPGSDVIDIPLQNFTWSWQVDATSSTINNKTPESMRNISGVDTNVFPTWNNVLTN